MLRTFQSIISHVCVAQMLRDLLQMTDVT